LATPKHAFHERKLKKKNLIEKYLEVLVSYQFKPQFFTEEIIQVCPP